MSHTERLRWSASALAFASVKLLRFDGSDVDWLNGLLRVERGMVERNVDDSKTDKSRRTAIGFLRVRRNSGGFPTRTPACGASSTGQAKQRSWSHGHAHIPALLPDVDRGDRDTDWRSAKTQAAL